MILKCNGDNDNKINNKIINNKINILFYISICLKQQYVDIISFILIFFYLFLYYTNKLGKNK